MLSPTICTFLFADNRETCQAVHTQPATDSLTRLTRLALERGWLLRGVKGLFTPFLISWHLDPA